ncbi:54S ribosomal protein L31, mitochondrial [[Candida] jaroonii]|uniref:54S ribosomal protein L31, mitochondrial n=1 Tax=[Candida] jaroonii TaxID=467808 RepID=A0ACA9Y5K5_9ASCO|nr:54S ribosomal protein L31, mitochondrial [[Candida] jaroonii]
MRPSLVNLGGYLWKSAPRLSPPQKSRLRSRMRLVDNNIESIFEGLVQAKPTSGTINTSYMLNSKVVVGNKVSSPKIEGSKESNGNEELTGYKKIDYLKYQFPKENEMLPKDKYTTFDKKAKNYRKLVFKVPKWTKKSFRENPIYH